MNIHRVLVGGMFGALLPASAFAGGNDLRAQAQFELLPHGSEGLHADSATGSTTATSDADVAYAITGMIDYPITPNFAIGVAPRLVFNVKVNDATFRNQTGEELDLRAHLLGHVPVARGVELYASLSPGYAEFLDDAHSDLSGFALGGALGATYQVSPRVFLSGELGYQRVFGSSRDLTIPIPGTNGIVLKTDVDLSYLHLGFGAGTHF